jgi:hypothetical protein
MNIIIYASLFISNPRRYLRATALARTDIECILYIVAGPNQFEFHPGVSIFKLESLDVLLRD